MILTDKLKDGINRVLEKYSLEIQFPLDNQLLHKDA